MALRERYSELPTRGKRGRRRRAARVTGPSGDRGGRGAAPTPGEPSCRVTRMSHPVRYSERRRYLSLPKRR